MRINSSFPAANAARLDRRVTDTLARLSAGVAVRPRDTPAAADRFERSRAEENALRTATTNTPRAVAFADAAAAGLGRAAGVLDELRGVFAQAAPTAADRDRVQALLGDLDRLGREERFAGRTLFPPAAPTLADAAAPAAGPDGAPAPEPAAGPRGEVLRVQTGLTLRGNATAVSFSAPLEDAVVIAAVAPGGDPFPVTARVTDVTEGGAQLRLDEFEFQDGVRNPSTVNLLALEAGSYELSDGRRLEVGAVQAGATPTRIEFEGDFGGEAPVVFTTLQSRNDPRAAVIRHTNASATGVDVFLQNEEAESGRPPATETVGFLAVSSGSFDLNGLTLTAVSSGDRVTHTTTQVSTGAGAADPVAFASLQSFDGPDTAFARLQSVGPDAVGVSVQEEASRDAETDHTTESVGVLVAGGVGRIEPVTPEAPAPTPPPASRGNRLATTGQLALAPNGLELPTLDRRALGGGGEAGGLTLADLTGDLLDVLDGDRAQALGVIDAARGQVRRSALRAGFFAEHELGAVDRVTRRTLGVVQEGLFRQESAAADAAAAEVAELQRLAAGQAVAGSAAGFEQEQALRLLAAAGGGPTRAPEDLTGLAAERRRARVAGLTGALAAYRQRVADADATRGALLDVAA